GQPLRGAGAGAGGAGGGGLPHRLRRADAPGADPRPAPRRAGQGRRLPPRRGRRGGPRRVLRRPGPPRPPPRRLLHPPAVTAAGGGVKGPPTHLVVSPPSWIGDAVMATPAVRALRRRFAGARLVGVCKPYVAGVLEGADWFDEVVLAHGGPWSQGVAA